MQIYKNDKRNIIKNLGEDEQVPDALNEFFENTEVDFPLTDEKQAAEYFEEKYSVFSPAIQKEVQAKRLVQDLRQLERQPIDK